MASVCGKRDRDEFESPVVSKPSARTPIALPPVKRVRIGNHDDKDGVIIDQQNESTSWKAKRRLTLDHTATTTPPRRVESKGKHDPDGDVHHRVVVPAVWESATPADVWLSHVQREAKVARVPEFPTTAASDQSALDDSARALLVEWLGDVVCEHGYTIETLHLAVQLADRTMAVATHVLDTTHDAISFANLQLVGTTALWIAVKTWDDDRFERIPVDPFVEYTAATYTKAEVCAMEHRMLRVLGWDVQPVTSVHALALLGDSRPQTHERYDPGPLIERAQAILTRALLDAPQCRAFPPSEQALAVLLVLGGTWVDTPGWTRPRTECVTWLRACAGPIPPCGTGEGHG